MNNKKNIDDYFDDNFEVTYTGDLPSIPVGQDDYDDRYDDTDYLNDYETDDYYDETDRLAPDYDGPLGAEYALHVRHGVGHNGLGRLLDRHGVFKYLFTAGYAAALH